jgi:hypothetical protein
MIAHNPQAAKRAGVPQSVGRDYVAADKAAGPRKLPEHIKRPGVINRAK